ncbi:MAG: tRNA pseudouridine synthase A [Candidatus Caenarcaniphilales bacterium]|nr:tRNA pseudouridine synthase A [Candidatus Caenarcaniphilales bacterium]
MKQRFVLQTQFLGSSFCGSQSQANGRAVQDELERALKVYFRQNIRVVLGSRVDSGVHARAMIGHFDLNLSEIPQFDFNEILLLRNLNGILSKDVSITRLSKIHQEFHSIKDATSRSYIYKLRAGTSRKPLDEKQVTFVYNSKPLNIKTLQNCAEILIGEKDFSGLANFKKGYVNPICKVFECSWKLGEEDPELYVFYIKADHFLYNMIRIIVGTQIAIGNGKLSVCSLEKALRFKDRSLSGPTASASGLCLKEINYPFSLFT